MPEKAGSRYFYTRNDGLQNQSVLYVRDGLNGAPRMLIDPNTWSQDGATALAEWDPSEDGRHLLYSVQDGGTDWRTVRVLDVATGQPTQRRGPLGQILQPRLGQGRLGLLLFALPRAGRGPAVPVDSTRTRPSISTASARRRARTGWSTRRPTGRGSANNAEVSDDGRWLIVYSVGGHRRPLRDHPDRPRPAGRARRAGSSPASSMTGPISAISGTTFYWQTNNGAPRQRIVATDIARPAPTLREIVAARTRRRCDGASIVGRQLIAALSGRREERGPHLRPRRPPHRHDRACPASAASAASTATRRAARPSTASPASTGPARSTATTARPAQSSVFAEPRARLRSGAITRSARSSTLRRTAPGCRCSWSTAAASTCAGRSRPCSTAMAASTRPSCPRFQPHWMTWVDMGGVLAVANLRGGGEYGAGLARCRPPRQQAERVRRFHRRGRISDRARASRPTATARHRGPLERRPAGRRGAQPAAGPVRRGAARPSA